MTEADYEIPLKELQEFEQIFTQQKEEGNRPTHESQFNYGWALVCSKYKQDKQKGIRLLQGKAF